MSKPLCTFLCLTALSGLGLVAQAETPAETIANLQKEVATLRIALGETTNEVIIPKQGEVEAKVSHDAAISRVNEANQVARQWRSRAIALQRELNYTKALMASQGIQDSGPSEESIVLPKFRGASVEERPALAVITDVALHPTYVALR